MDQQPAPARSKHTIPATVPWRWNMREFVLFTAAARMVCAGAAAEGATCGCGIASSEAQICRPDCALLAPQPAPDCGFGRSTSRPSPRSARLKLEYERKWHQTANKIVREYCACCKPQQGTERRPFDNDGSAKRRWVMRQGSAHTTSHFSAALDQHYPQAATFSLYECSKANSRREFRTETRKSSSESDDEYALRFARGSSTR